MRFLPYLFLREALYCVTIDCLESDLLLRLALYPIPVWSKDDEREMYVCIYVCMYVLYMQSNKIHKVIFNE